MSHDWHFRVYTPCSAVLGTRTCEREVHGKDDHWYSVWEFDYETEEHYPSGAVYWSTWREDAQAPR